MDQSQMAMAGAAVVGAAVLGVYTMSSGSTPVKSNAKRNQQRSKKAEPAPPPVVPQQKERSPAEQEALRKKRAASKARAEEKKKDAAAKAAKAASAAVEQERIRVAKLMKIADKESAQRQKDYIAAAKAAKEAKLKQIEDAKKQHAKEVDDAKAAREKEAAAKKAAADLYAKNHPQLSDDERAKLKKEKQEARAARGARRKQEMADAAQAKLDAQKKAEAEAQRNKAEAEEAKRKAAELDALKSGKQTNFSTIAAEAQALNAEKEAKIKQKQEQKRAKSAAKREGARALAEEMAKTVDLEALAAAQAAAQAVAAAEAEAKAQAEAIAKKADEAAGLMVSLKGEVQGVQQRLQALNERAGSFEEKQKAAADKAVADKAVADKAAADKAAADTAAADTAAADKAAADKAAADKAAADKAAADKAAAPVPTESAKIDVNEAYLTYEDDVCLGKDCPALSTLVYVKGEPVEVGGGKNTVIVFFAKFAKGDYTTVQGITELSKQFPDVQFLAISVDPSKEDAESFLKKIGTSMPEIYITDLQVPYPIAFDDRKVVKCKFGQVAQMASVGPSLTFVVDGNGKLVWREQFAQGYFPPKNGQLGEQLRRLQAGEDLLKNGPKPVVEDDSEEEMGGEDDYDSDLGF